LKSTRRTSIRKHVSALCRIVARSSIDPAILTFGAFNPLQLQPRPDPASGHDWRSFQYGPARCRSAAAQPDPAACSAHPWPTPNSEQPRNVSLHRHHDQTTELSTPQPARSKPWVLSQTQAVPKPFLTDPDLRARFNA